MSTFFSRAWLPVFVTLVFAVGIFGCMDHQTPTPQRYRLKTITYLTATSANAATSTFYLTYDSNGRLTGYDNGPTIGSHYWTVGYDSQNRVSAISFVDRNQNGDFYNQYTYNQQNQLTQISRTRYPGRSTEPRNPVLRSTYDLNYASASATTPARLITTYLNSSSSLEQAYTFSGGNATQVGNKTYTYDDKPNPYKGLFGLNLYFSLDQGFGLAVPISPFTPSQLFTDLGVKVFNQNNITTDATLTYNKDGLVTKIRYNDGASEEFTYETY